MASGVEGVVQSSAGTFGPPVAVSRVSGNEGTIWTEGNTIRFAGPGGDREVPILPDFALPPMPLVTGDPRNQTARWQGLIAVELAPYTALCLNLKARILGESAPNALMPATFAEGLACMQVLDAMRVSANGGGRLVEIHS
jgi:hypothetical protein